MAADADLVRRLTDEVFVEGNLGAIDELLADDFVSHDMPGGLPGTRDGYRDLMGMVVSAMSDRRVDFDEVVDTADGRVVENWAVIATHSGEVLGLPPSRQTVRVRGVDIFRCSDGRIAEHWGAVDMSDLFEKAQAGGQRRPDARGTVCRRGHPPLGCGKVGRASERSRAEV